MSFSTTTATSTSELGSFGFYAPEVIRNEKHVTNALDVFSLGACIFYVLTGGLR